VSGLSFIVGGITPTLRAGFVYRCTALSCDILEPESTTAIVFKADDIVKPLHAVSVNAAYAASLALVKDAFLHQGRSSPRGAPFMRALVNHVHDASRTWFYQNRPTVHDGVAISRNVVFVGHIVVSDAAIRQYSSNSNFLMMPIGGPLLAHNVLTKARPIINPKNSSDRTSHCSNCTPYDSTGRSCGATASLCTLRCAAYCDLGTCVAGGYQSKQ
jgi:hypothetical protein